MRLRSIGAAALLVLVAALSRPAAAETTICTQITSVPWTISTPGVYCLNSDLNFAQSSGVAITIKASNVTLDLNRHVLSNSYVGICSSSATCSNAYGISVEYQSNVLIKNGSVRGFLLGIVLWDGSPWFTHGNVIEDIAAARNIFGLYVQGQGILVSQNRVTQTGGTSYAIGIFVSGPNNVVRNNEVLGTGNGSANGYAIYGSACAGLIVEDNRVSGIMSLVSDPSFGIYINSSAHTVIRNNTVDKADTSGAGYSLSYGIGFDYSTDNVVVGNQIATFYTGIYASSGTSSAQTNGNVVIGSSIPVTGTTAATTY